MQFARTEGLGARELDLCRGLAKALEDHAADVVTGALVEHAGLSRRQASGDLGAYLLEQPPVQQLRLICLLGDFMHPPVYVGAQAFTPRAPPGSTESNAAAGALFRRAFGAEPALVTARQVLAHLLQQGSPGSLLEAASRLAAAVEGQHLVVAVPALAFLEGVHDIIMAPSMPPAPAVEAALNDARVLRASVLTLEGSGSLLPVVWLQKFVALAFALARCPAAGAPRLFVHHDAGLVNCLLETAEHCWPASGPTNIEMGR